MAMIAMALPILPGKRSGKSFWTKVLMALVGLKLSEFGMR